MWHVIKPYYFIICPVFANRCRQYSWLPRTLDALQHHAKHPGIWEAGKDRGSASSESAERGHNSRAHLEHLSNFRKLRQAFVCAVPWRNWPSDAGFAGCRPWIETQSQHFRRNRWSCAKTKPDFSHCHHGMPDVREQLIVVKRSARESFHKSKQLSTQDFWGHNLNQTECFV